MIVQTKPYTAKAKPYIQPVVPYIQKAKPYVPPVALASVVLMSIPVIFMFVFLAAITFPVMIVLFNREHSCARCTRAVP